MARRWVPSQKQLSRYDELLRRQNEVREKLLKRRRIAEEETGGGGSLPDLVIPKKARRYRDKTRYKFDSYKAYRDAMKRLSQLFGGKTPLARFYKASYQTNVLNILKDWIVNKFGYDESPGDYKTANSKNPTIYSELQIKNVDSGLARLLTLYNDISKLNVNEFMALYDLKVFPSLHIIYDDITGESRFGEVDRFINEFNINRKALYKSSAYKELLKAERDVERGNVYDYGKAVKNRSKERLEEIREKDED